MDYEKEIKNFTDQINHKLGGVKILSCQVVDFGLNINDFAVYSYCHNFEHYYGMVDNHFSIETNKSLLPLYKKKNENPSSSFWYCQIDTNESCNEITCDYKYYISHSAHQTFNDVKDCDQEWEKWVRLIKTIYPYAQSVFFKKIEIESGKDLKSYCGIFLSLASKIELKEQYKVNILSEKFLNKIAFESLIPQFYQNLTGSAALAALSQASVRNASHNLGSHVLNNLISVDKFREFSFTKLENYKNYYGENNIFDSTIYDIKKVLEEKKAVLIAEHLAKLNENKVLKTLTADQLNKIANEAYELYSNEFNSLLKDDELPCNEDINKLLQLLVKLLEYIKNRSEYLADVSFGTPDMMVGKKLYSEVFKPFDANRLLLNNISGLNDFKFTIKLERTTVCKVDVEIAPLTKDITSADDVSVAFPNDVLGQQAFYNIIENVIRNTAKHNQNKKTEKETDEKNSSGSDENKNWTTFTINVIDIKDDNEYYKIELYDDIDMSKEKLNSTCECDKKVDENCRCKIKEYFDIEDNEIKNLHKIVYELNTELNGSILRDYKIRTTALGLMEMETSACYLRMLPLDSVQSIDYNLNEKYKSYHDNDYTKTVSFYNNNLEVKLDKNGDDKNANNDKGKYNLLRAFIKVKDVKKHLGYVFFMLKPKDYLMVGFENDFKKEYPAIDGIDFMTEIVLEEALLKNRTATNEEVQFPHQFIIYKEDKIKNDLYEKYKTELPYRWLQLDATNDGLLRLLKNKSDKKEIDECVWQKHWEKNIKESCLGVDITVDSFGNKDYKDKYRIGFQDHIKKKIWKEMENEISNPEKHSIEALSSLAQKTIPEMTPTLTAFPRAIDNNIVVKYKLYESSKSKILILDERVQKLYETENYMGIPYKDLYRYSHITVPFSKDPEDGTIVSEFLDLGQASFDDDFVTKFKNYLDCDDSEEKKYEKGKYEIIVLHYSLLERLNIKGENRKIFLKNLAQKCYKLVLTSGRGNPRDELKDYNASFIGLAALINAVHTTSSKYLLYNILTNSRK